MFFAVNTSMWTDHFSERQLPLLEKISDWGGTGVEIACSRFDGFPAAAIRRELGRLVLTCTLSASPPSAGQTLIHDDPGFRRAGVDYLREAIGVAGELGATLSVGPFYAHVAWFTGARPTPDQFRWAVEGFQAVVPDLSRTGVGMAIEPMNRFESFFLPTAADGVRLCKAIGSERIGLMLDTAHMVIGKRIRSPHLRRPALGSSTCRRRRTTAARLEPGA